MSVLSCPLCGWRVNAAAGHCPDCGADLRLERDAAFADLLARTGPPSSPLSARPVRRRDLTRRRPALLITLAAVLIVALTAPLWAGYFGPTAATYVSVWRPWRSQFSVQVERDPVGRPGDLMMVVDYKDPWPGQTRTPGYQTEFLTLKRVRPWLPWAVTERGSGP